MICSKVLAEIFLSLISSSYSFNYSKAIYIRLVDMKCPLVVVILIYTHLMQVCWIVTLWEVSRLITQPLIISIVTETCTSFDCIAIRIDHVSQPNIYSLAWNNLRFEPGQFYWVWNQWIWAFFGIKSYLYNNHTCILGSISLVLQNCIWSHLSIRWKKSLI